MATVTVYTAERTAEIEATTVVDGEVNADGHLVLVQRDGTPIDAGAVSGVKVNSGSGYAKADVFSFVGPTDPGAVPDGSVWLDTNEPAGPIASLTKKGLVELATAAETLAGTDTQRAVTPAGLAAIPGNKVQVLAMNANTEGALPGAYPAGLSLMLIGASSGWSINSGYGSVFTLNTSTDRCVQIAYANVGGTQAPRSWVRHYHPTGGNGGWTAWAAFNTMVTLLPASITQTTAIAAYPAGWSRVYFTTANSTGWDFAGTAGELLTYTEGTDFGKQTWTKHVNGALGVVEVWHRTSNAVGGWSPWQRLLNDPGAWIAYTPTWTTQSGLAVPSFGANSLINCRYTKVGRKVDVKFEIEFGSGANFGGGGTGDNWQFSLPVAAARTNDSLGFMELNNNSNAAVCMGRARAYNANGFRIGIISGRVDGSAISNGDLDTISPFVWVAGSSIRGHLTYESAA